MGNSPAFASVPRSASGQVSAANANRDGTGTIVSIFTPPAAGARIEEVYAQATVTTTAGMVRLFISNDSGVTWRLFDELPVTAVAVAASTPGWRTKRAYTNLILADATWRLGASTNNAEAINIFAFGGDLT